MKLKFENEKARTAFLKMVKNMNAAKSDVLMGAKTSTGVKVLDDWLKDGAKSITGKGL